MASVDFSSFSGSPNFVDWEQIGYVSFLETFHNIVEDPMTPIQTPYLHVHLKNDTSENGNVQDGSGNEVVDANGNNVITTNKSLLMQARWDWAVAD